MFDPGYVSGVLHQLASRAPEQETLPDLPRFCA